MRLAPDMRAEIVELDKQGVARKEIARRMGVHLSTIFRNLRTKSERPKRVSKQLSKRPLKARRYDDSTRAKIVEQYLKGVPTSHIMRKLDIQSYNTIYAALNRHGYHKRHFNRPGFVLASISAPASSKTVSQPQTNSFVQPLAPSGTLRKSATHMCIDLLKKHPESSSLVAKILEELEAPEQKQISCEMPQMPIHMPRPVTRHVKRVKMIRKTVKPVIHRKPVLPVHPKPEAKRTRGAPTNAPVSFEIRPTKIGFQLYEKHGNRNSFRVTKDQYDAVAKAVEQGFTGGDALHKASKIPNHLIHTVMRFLATKGHATKVHNVFTPVQAVGFAERAEKEWTAATSGATMPPEIETAQDTSQIL